jgi:hypothetical protein
MARKDRINQNPFNIEIDVNTPIKKVNEKNPLAYPQFLFPVTGVSPFRGFIRPTLRAIRVDAHTRFLNSGVPWNPCSQTLQGWADEASSGTHHRSGNDETHPSSIGSDTEGRVGEALERLPPKGTPRRSHTPFLYLVVEKGRVPDTIHS